MPPDLPDNYADALAREIVHRTGRHIRLALPLGLGKAVTVANALTRLAERDRSIRLDIFTALTLERPVPASDMHRRMLGPAMDRLFGAYPALRYGELRRQGMMPPNISVREFFFLAGTQLGNRAAQAEYITANYTLAFDYLMERRPNVLAQLLAQRDGRLSLSCNTDITADLLKARREGDADFLMVGEVNADLPYMSGPAEIDPEEVGLLHRPANGGFELFSAVNRPVSLADHAIGLHVSRLVRDGGTLQVGIGQIGDAVSSALLLRHHKPETAARLWADCPFPLSPDFVESGTFAQGLYAVTEMLVEGIVALVEAGIIRREVAGASVHAGFFLGSRAFYRRLRDMPEADRSRIAMMPVSFTNQLYGDEAAKRTARQDARFVNSAMKMTLLGGAVSDTSSGGQTVSGVGGQYNFVAQAHALKSGRSVLAVTATRRRKGRTHSNIVWDHPHETIPRHLRDIVVTEYGIADLRGRSDEEAILAMAAIADSRFQNDLIDRAKAAGKLRKSANLPEGCRDNSPAWLSAWLDPYRQKGALPRFPFGTDFTETEQRLLPALARLKETEGSWSGLARMAIRGAATTPTAEEHRCLERLDLANTASLRAIVQRWLVLAALRHASQG